MNDKVQYGEDAFACGTLLYGDGFLSPGGAEELGRILEGLDLTGRDVLDLGCGIGGGALALVRDHGAGRVVAVDVEAPAIARAEAAVTAAGLSDRIDVRFVVPGPLPLADGAFDLVFSKDAISHIADKAALWAEVFRLLRPGGAFAASDWLIGHDAPRTEAFRDWTGQLRESGLSFHSDTREGTLAGLESAGFESVDFRDRSDWTTTVSRRQLDYIEADGRAALLEIMGEAGRDALVRRTRARIGALEGGDLLHGHLRARKPIGA